MQGGVTGFAYGSNMHRERLRARVPSARAFAIGRLAGHLLAWDKRGRDGSAKCDAAFTGRPEDHVWGVLFTMLAAEKPWLDTAEGLGRGYDERFVEVLTDSGPVRAQMYVATDRQAGLLPFDWYRHYVVEGARQHGLPAAYIARLAATPAMPDPDAARAALNRV